jgi:hypothetical protein
MVVRLPALRARRALLPRNIIIFMFLVLISVRGRKQYLIINVSRKLVSDKIA